MKEWYTQQEVSKLLGVSKQTVYRYEKQGKLRRIHDPYSTYRYVRYEKEDVDQLVEKKNKHPEGKKPIELAKDLGISVQTIYRYIQEGLIETVQVPFGNQRTKHLITANGEQQARSIINEYKKEGVQRFEYYDSKLKIALFQKFSSPTIEDARITRDSEHDWVFYIPNTGEVLPLEKGLHEYGLKPCYSIHQDTLPTYKGYAQLRVPKDFRYVYELIDYFYSVWGIENVRLREEDRVIILSIKEGEKAFSVTFDFSMIERFISEGNWWVYEGDLFVQSAYKKTTIELPISMIKKIQRKAKSKEITMSQFIEEVLQDYIN